MFVANGDAVAVNATGVEITPGGAACIHQKTQPINEVIQMNNQHPNSTEENPRPSWVGESF